MVRARGRVVLLVLVLTALAGAFTLFITDIDTFEARTGFFDRVGSWILDGILGIAAFFGALTAASLVFPKRWGPKASVGGALFGALIALWFGYVLLRGGV